LRSLLFIIPPPVLRKNKGELREIGISKTGEQSFLFLSSPLALAFFFPTLWNEEGKLPECSPEARVSVSFPLVVGLLCPANGSLM